MSVQIYVAFEFCRIDCCSAVLQLSAWKPTAGFTSTFSDPSIGMWVKCSTLSDYLKDEPKFPHRLHCFENNIGRKEKGIKSD